MTNLTRPQLKTLQVARDCSAPAMSLRMFIESGGLGTNPSRRPRRSTSLEEYIQRLKRILEEHPHVSVSLSEAAEFLNLERTWCCKAFRLTTGQSFSAWIRGIRIGKAKNLLWRTEYSITEVSHAVGYEDITTFCRNFKKELGVNPRSFRKLNP